DLDIRGAGDLLGAEQSGFISEMGVEMYYKVLNEAIEELKEEMPEIQAANYTISETASAGIPCTLQHGKFVKDCQLETDAEALIPDDYVQSGEERLRLYRELDDAADETAVLKFEYQMKDRFGNIPPIVQKLTDIVRLRLIAIDLGIERIVYKNKTLICFFVSKHDSPYYTSPVFASVVEYVKTHPQLCRMKEAAATPASAEAKLSLTVSGVKDVKDALNTLRRILNRSTEA
ncbi:MAG: transcription-repair coupling factor, partial [Bacteroidia bacterium]|nr:transcription-repair coupling factor [Bacteroidia bacterium]